MTPTVFLFAKPPMMGLSKTRLARGLGKAEAQRIARFTLTRTLRAARDPRWSLILYASPRQHLRTSLGGLWPPTLARRDQGTGTLGDRLARAYHAAAPGPVIFIGADCPDLSHHHIWQAAKALRTAHIVAGPALDGGFWLLGLRKTRRMNPPFSPVRWSTHHALADVLRNAPADTRIHHLQPLLDIDTADDWRQWNQ